MDLFTCRLWRLSVNSICCICWVLFLVSVGWLLKRSSRGGGGRFNALLVTCADGGAGSRLRGVGQRRRAAIISINICIESHSSGLAGTWSGGRGHLPPVDQPSAVAEAAAGGFVFVPGLASSRFAKKRIGKRESIRWLVFIFFSDEQVLRYVCASIARVQKQFHHFGKFFFPNPLSGT